MSADEPSPRQAFPLWLAAALAAVGAAVATWVAVAYAIPPVPLGVAVVFGVVAGVAGGTGLAATRSAEGWFHFAPVLGAFGFIAAGQAPAAFVFVLSQLVAGVLALGVVTHRMSE